MKTNPVPAFFYALGCLTFLKFVVKTLVVFGETFILPGTDVSVVTCVPTVVSHNFNYQLKKFGAGKGSWAGKESCNFLCDVRLTGRLVITGASDGIGREYAIQLAKKGLDVLVVARNEIALKSVTDEIGQFPTLPFSPLSHNLPERTQLLVPRGKSRANPLSSMSPNPITVAGNNSKKFCMRLKSASWVRGVVLHVFLYSSYRLGS